MKYRIEIWSLDKIMKTYEKDNLNLNPDYQRRFIWSLKDQQDLINSILKGYAIPNIFLYNTMRDKYDMVDGQQRVRTILAFKNKEFKTKDGLLYSDDRHGSKFKKYLVPITIIESIGEDESIEEFYALVNKSGIHLNRPELKKAEYFDTNFLKLVTELADSSEFKSLGLFTDSSSKRMNDVDFVAELVAQMVHGVTDKKLKVDRIFDEDITSSKKTELKKEFKTVLKIFKRFDNKKRIKSTRYKQRNDFYSLFGFVHQNMNEENEFLDLVYSLLCSFNDKITPSNEKCEPFQEYAFHCVSQSNSKNAREQRQKILNDLFLNRSVKPNRRQKKVLKYYKIGPEHMKQFGDYLTFDLKEIPSRELFD